MRRIINRKMYDTDIANEVAYWENMADVSNFYRVEQKLYRKRNGEFFILEYSLVWHDNNVGDREYQIIPLLENEVKDWLERTNNTDIYIKLFGEPEE